MPIPWKIQLKEEKLILIREKAKTF
jgi:hypothetical protein